MKLKHWILNLLEGGGLECHKYSVICRRLYYVLMCISCAHVDMFPSNLFGLINESSKMIPGIFFFTCSAFTL